MTGEADPQHLQIPREVVKRRAFLHRSEPTYKDLKQVLALVLYVWGDMFGAYL